MSQKEESKDGQCKEVRNDHKERKTGEKEVHTKDIPESSAQGEARATNGTNGPYCYRCLTRDHPKEECIVILYCDICESAAHVKGRCPLLKKAKTTYALTCGYVVDSLGFCYIQNSVAV
jgi:hypothetical protein